jgi:hypothetical protein
MFKPHITMWGVVCRLLFAYIALRTGNEQHVPHNPSCACCKTYGVRCCFMSSLEPKQYICASGIRLLPSLPNFSALSNFIRSSTHASPRGYVIMRCTAREVSKYHGMYTAPNNFGFQLYFLHWNIYLCKREARWWLRMSSIRIIIS